MSSFICSSKHFASIEHALTDYVKSNDFNKYSFGKEFTPLDIANFVDNLRELNVLCVSFQYKDHYKGTLDNEIKEQLEIVRQKEKHKTLTLLGLYNALSCLNYQLETEHIEGLFDNLVEAAMPLLEKFKSDIAETIVSKLPDDNTNTWEVN